MCYKVKMKIDVLNDEQLENWVKRKGHKGKKK